MPHPLCSCPWILADQEVPSRAEDLRRRHWVDGSPWDPHHGVGSDPGGRQAEFTIPGLYTCPDSMHSPFNYGTRARIVMHHADPFGNNQYPTELPWTQFIFRGEGTVEGA